MQKEYNIDVYRREIVSNDHFHKGAALIIGLIIVGLAITYDFIHNRELMIYVPLLTIAMLGVIIRLEIFVHRQGGFLKEVGDPWEKYRDQLAFDRYGVAIADILMTIPVLVCLIAAFDILSDIHPVANRIFGGIILLEIVLWLIFPRLARVKKSEE